LILLFLLYPFATQGNSIQNNHSHDAITIIMIIMKPKHENLLGSYNKPPSMLTQCMIVVSD